MRAHRLALALGLSVCVPSVARAQCIPGGVWRNTECDTSAQARPAWAGELAALGVNAALGGLTAGLLQTWRGGDFSDAFTRGALGGIITYAGKRVTVQRFDGAGLVGRQVAAVGDAFVRNAAEGIPLLDRLYFPLYFIRLEVRPHAAERRVQPRFDVISTGWTVYAVAEPELEFDAGKSLSAGALVFQTDGKLMQTKIDGYIASGRAIGSLIFLAERADMPAEAHARTFAHERVHTLQFHQSLTYWAGPLEEWALTRIGAPGLARWLDFNLASQVAGLVVPALDYGDRPWEIEAQWLAR